MAISDLFDFDTVADDAAKARRSDISTNTISTMLAQQNGGAAKLMSAGQPAMSQTPTSATMTSQQAPFGMNVPSRRLMADLMTFFGR